MNIKSSRQLVSLVRQLRNEGVASFSVSPEGGVSISFHPQTPIQTYQEEKQIPVAVSKVNTDALIGDVQELVLPEEDLDKAAWFDHTM